MQVLNATHDPKLKSWVESANAPGADFPIQNLPHGVFRPPGGEARGGVAIGDSILDVGRAIDLGLLSGAAAEAAAAPALNGLLEMGASALSEVRRAVSALLADTAERRDEILWPAAECEMLLPVQVGAFTDFLCSFYHSAYARVGRPARQLDRAFKHLPIGYNSRASTVVVSGHPLVRPNGQGWDEEAKAPYFGPTRKMDFELEMGAVLGGAPNPVGEPVPIARAEEHLLAYVLLNDWSARDIQHFENRLGPFLGKSCLTSISPWLITAEALAPFRAPAFPRTAEDPKPFPYLDDAENRASGSLDITMSAWLTTPKLRAEGAPAIRLCETNFKDAAFWNFGQMLAHHASNGCAMRPGDILGSGTCSAEPQDTAATYLEITSGVVPFALPNGETRLWLEDGDEIILKGRAERDGFVSIGFGECAGQVLPALPQPT